MACSSKIDQKFLFQGEKRIAGVLYGDYGEICVELEQYGACYSAAKIYTRVLKNMKQKHLEDALERECYRNSKLCHPNILRFLGFHYDSSEDSSVPLLVTELVRATLLSLVEFRRFQFANSPLYIKLSILLDASSGLWYLHSRNPPIVHGEVSPSSIFLTEQLVAKIGSLGLANAIQPDQTDKDLMTRGYAKVFLAPEVTQETAGYTNPMIDVFSFGAVILYLMNQEWPEPCEKVVKHRFRKNVILSEAERRQKYLDMMSGYTAVLKPLVEDCMKDNPDERSKIEDICNKLRKLHEPYSKVDSLSWRLQLGISKAVATDKEVKLNDKIRTTRLHLDQQEKLISSLKVCEQLGTCIYMHVFSVVISSGIVSQCVHAQ